MNKDLEKINIDSEASLAFLIKRFSEQPGFAKAFVFANDDLCKRFFESINVDWNLFQKKYYYMIKSVTFISQKVNLDLFGSAPWDW